MFCHGDNPDGHGLFASALTPPPANFEDPGTIAMLQEAYLFWRIAKGGPGLPKESTPWNSVMPAWEDRLSEEQIFPRSEEHTSELQSRPHLVCRLLLEKKNKLTRRTQLDSA